MTDLLSIGASGVRAYQTALTTVSENIANSSTAGYVRRSADMREVTSLGGKSANLNGLGVSVSGITRAGDPYTETSLRSASADLSKTEASKVWLQRIESSLGGANLSQQMTSFFAAGTALQAEPTSTALRASMMSSASSVSDSFGLTAKALSDAQTELDSRGTQATNELTRLNQALYKVNQGLGRTQGGTAASAQLSDQRDQILEQMSALTDVNVSLDPAGRATVRAGGANGPVLVDSNEAADVSYARANGNVVISVGRSTGVSSLVPQGGALAGMMEGAQQLQSTVDELNATASDFVSKVNTLQNGGDDLNGAPGATMFVSTGSDPTSFKVADNFTPANIAAASRGGGQRDSSNLTALASLRTSGNYEGRVQSLITNNAATLQQRTLVSDAQSAIHDGAVTAKSQASGVNLDSEAVDLVRFQQAYQASSRVIQIARDTFQSLLDIR